MSSASSSPRVRAFPSSPSSTIARSFRASMATIRAMLRRAHERGELKTDALVRFPQLLPAPGIVAIIWSGLFDRFEPLDVRAMMRAHFDVLLGPRSARMNARRIALLGAALLALAACSKADDPGYQGWVEADLIFVSPDEAGRVDTLSVREGDVVEKGAPLFAVDPELQQADVEMAKASVTNATQALRARPGAAQDLGRHAEDPGGCRGGAAHRAGAARLGADPAGAPQDGQPGDRLGAADLLPAGRGRCRPGGRWFRSCRRATSRSGSSCRRRCCRRSRSARR